MANQADLSVRAMCRVLGVSASGFYAWRERAPSQRSIVNAVMTERIRQIHQDSHESYGMPRVRAELIEQGVCIVSVASRPLLPGRGDQVSMRPYARQWTYP